MKYNFYSGLSGKTASIFLLAFVAVVLPVNWIVYEKVKSTLIQADTQQLQAEAEKLASLTKLDPVIVPLPAPGYSVNVIQFSQGIVEPIFISPDFPMQQTELLLFETMDVDTLKLFRKRVIQSNGIELWFTLGRSNQALNQQLAEIKAYLFYLTGGAFSLLVILVFLISGIMFKPLKRLADSANQVQASDKMQRLPVPTSRDETHQLAMALNEMIARIESTINYQIKFFDSATHELKTPLSIMQAELSKAYASAKDLSSQQWILNLKEEAERLERSIADFLLLSQLKNQTLSLRKQHVHLSELVFDVMQKLKKLADERGLTFSVRQDEVDQPIFIDADKVQTVIFNLIENAIRYSPEGSNINIVIKSFGAHICIINPMNSPVHSIGALGNNRYTESQRGMGLGLWISKQLVELHQGSLQFNIANNLFQVELKLKS